METGKYRKGKVREYKWLRLHHQLFPDEEPPPAQRQQCLSFWAFPMQNFKCEFTHICVYTYIHVIHTDVWCFYFMYRIRLIKIFGLLYVKKKFFFCFFIAWLCWVLGAVREHSPVVASRGCSSKWLLLSLSTGSRVWASAVVAHRLSSVAHGP